MPKYRPLGITIFAVILTFIGGFLTLILFFEILATISFSGLESIFITNIYSFGGFMIYGAAPIISYVTGVGLFTSRPWALKSVLFVIPPLLFISFINLACSLAQSRNTIYLFKIKDLIKYSPEPFLFVTVFYTIIIFPMIVYFRNPFIIIYFNKTSS